MIFHILGIVFIFGLALLLGVFSVVRGLYTPGTFPAPRIPSDCGGRPRRV